MFTQWIPPYTQFRTRCLLVAGLALTFLLAAADAAPPKKKAKPKPKPANVAKTAPQKKANPKPKKQNVSNAQLHEAQRVLQTTKKILEGANHDYGGHRIEAIKAISAAQNQLKLALGGQSKPQKPAGKTGKGGKPQSISNLQLADAIPVLMRTRTHLQKTNHNYGGHRSAAIHSLDGAIHQLQAALKFEKKRAS